MYEYIYGDNGKTCCVCGITKPLTEYFRASNFRGLMGACKVCHTARNQRANEKYKEKRKAQRRRYNETPERRAAAYENTKKMYSLHREHQLARMKVYHAVKTGKLQKKPCQRCSEIKVQAHHDDYDKPLEVLWLCIPHHKKLHKEMLAN